MSENLIRKNLIWLMRGRSTEQKRFYLNYPGGAQRLAADIYEHLLPTVGMGW